MYRMTCDGHPLLDSRDDDYILGSPRVKTEVNTVGEGSFKIYFNHPNINKLVPLRSVFEVTDEYGVLFRGRMTEDTKDIINGIDVDLEGAMAYFNDSVVRPYVFPDDFEEDAEYIAAKAETPAQAAIDGGVVRFFLKWFIERHNEQVEPFQQFKLGNVTVYDKNNYIERASSDYPSTWKELSEKTFNSSLGGFLCIRYEADGNYIDYLREFTEVNEQGITYGENMLDISQNTDASGTYSAIIPLGASSTTTTSNGEVYEGMYGDIVGGSSSERKLTIESLPNGNITDDIVKEGDMLYSKRARAAYGLRIAPRDETTWDDVEEPENLQSKGVEFLEGDSTKIPNTIKVTAVDLNCTDSQIRSFRIYKKIPVYTPAHGINDDFDLTALDTDLLDPQKTKITVGKTVMTITEYQAKQQTNLQSILGGYATKQQVIQGFVSTEALIEKTEGSILQSVSETYATQTDLKTTQASITTMAGTIRAEVSQTYATQATVNTISGQLELKVGKNDNDQIVSMLNASADEINITSNRLSISSTNFTLSKDGTISATNANISGTLNVTNGGKIGALNVTGDALVAGGVKIDPTFGIELYNSSQRYYKLSYDGVDHYNGSYIVLGATWQEIIDATSYIKNNVNAIYELINTWLPRLQAGASNSEYTYRTTGTNQKLTFAYGLLTAASDA